METTVNGWSYISAIFNVLLRECEKYESLIEPQFIFRGITRRHFTTSKTIQDDLNTKVAEIMENSKESSNAFKNAKTDYDKVKVAYEECDRRLRDYFRQPTDKKPEELLSEVMTKDCLRYAVPEYINSGAVVRMQQKTKQISKIDFINYNKHMLADLKNRFPVYSDEEYTDIEILADVQHKGAASCLIDFSTDFLTSLWFATKEHPNEIGYLFCYDINKEMLEEDMLYILNSKYIGRSIEDLLNETTKTTKYSGKKVNKFWLWKPSNLNERIMMQDSVFVFGLEPFLIKQHKIITIPIPPEWKSPIQHVLKSFFGVTAESIFYDIDGYAESNSKLKPYVKTYLHYFSEQYDKGNSSIELDELQNGMECLFQSEYELALKYFTLFESKLSNPSMIESKLKIQGSYSSNHNNLFYYLRLSALYVDVHYSKGVCLKHLGAGNEYAAIKEFIKAKDRCQELFRHCSTHPESLQIKDEKEAKHLANYRNYFEKKSHKANNDLINLYYSTRQYSKIINNLKEMINDSQKKNDEDAMHYFVTLLFETACIEAIYDRIYSMNVNENLLDRNDNNDNMSGKKSDKKGRYRKLTDRYDVLENLNKKIRQDATSISMSSNFKETQPLYYVLICYYKYVYDVLFTTNGHEKEFNEAIESGLNKNEEYQKENCFTSWDLSIIIDAIKETKQLNNRTYVKLMTITSQVTDFMNNVQGRIKNDER